MDALPYCRHLFDKMQGVYTGAPYHNAEKEQIALLTVEETQPNDRKNNHVILPFWE
jgi:hypothetical protein